MSKIIFLLRIAWLLEPVLHNIVTNRKMKQKELSFSGWENARSPGTSEERSGAQRATVPVQEPAEGEEEEVREQLLSLLVVLWWKKLEKNDLLAFTASSIQSLATPLLRQR